MSPTDFPSAAYDLSLIPPDEPDETDAADHLWQDYCAEASQLDRRHIKDAVLSSLDADESLLDRLIDSCIKHPCEPGRARESITVLAQYGQALLDLTAAAVDDGVNLRMMTGDAR